MKKIIFLLLFFIPSLCFSASTPQQLISNSQQMIIVFTPNLKSHNGQLQRFERYSAQHPWIAVGKSIPVVVGKNGLGWDAQFRKEQNHTIIKKEGDGLTPIGIYELGPTFGFAEKSTHNNYFPLTDSSFCVDDVKSAYYNKLIDTATIPKDWNSGEKMRQISQYREGAVVQYNSTPVQPGAGSCIFMHIWKNSTTGTAGCIAMEESNLKENLNWLDARKNPLLAILTLPIYKNVESTWQLPSPYFQY
ncbi:MAG TPA: L,D-transpeptidase family protein [Gammaproteobacteria bacterium]|jgi:D-alanyl-D-alanine dipeptidase|nr:L,D-transpeptidase family protein [Gammaproteobacteria bacterium]